MNKALNKHLDSITEDSFTEWLNENSFISYASHTIKGGVIQLGTTGIIYSVVITINKVVTEFNTLSMEKAIDYYKKVSLENVSQQDT